ncbi:DUF2637 domain-containing protein [Nocardia sp. NPDC004568]|uniref:DUF2637 domain-containing protein n=1 Tax=Nocardia sp. NPDC004568 TaxID=3154551 RepID=UPI0033B6FB13
MTAPITAGVFWLSFTALRALTATAGIPAGEAWLWPLTIEGPMAQATVPLLALAHSSARRTAAPAHHDPDTARQNIPRGRYHPACAGTIKSRAHAGTHPTHRAARPIRWCRQSSTRSTRCRLSKNGLRPLGMSLPEDRCAC